MGGVGRGDIGGVFRYSDGWVLLQFCEKVRVESTREAEVMALGEGLLAATALYWVSTHSFVFESDLNSVIA